MSTKKWVSGSKPVCTDQNRAVTMLTRVHLALFFRVGPERRECAPARQQCCQWSPHLDGIERPQVESIHATTQVDWLTRLRVSTHVSTHTWIAQHTLFLHSPPAPGWRNLQLAQGRPRAPDKASKHRPCSTISPAPVVLSSSKMKKSTKKPRSLPAKTNKTTPRRPPPRRTGMASTTKCSRGSFR